MEPIDPRTRHRRQLEDGLRRKNCDQLVGLPQFLGQVERQISQYRDLDLGMVDGNLVEYSAAERPGTHRRIGMHVRAARGLSEHDHLAEAHPAGERSDPLMCAVG